MKLQSFQCAPHNFHALSHSVYKASDLRCSSVFSDSPMASLGPGGSMRSSNVLEDSIAHGSAPSGPVHSTRVDKHWLTLDHSLFSPANKCFFVLKEAVDYQQMGELERCLSVLTLCKNYFHSGSSSWFRHSLALQTLHRPFFLLRVFLLSWPSFPVQLVSQLRLQ